MTDTGTYNVEGTLTAWVHGAVSAYTPLAGMGAQVVRQAPEQPLETPVFAVEFEALQDVDSFQGGNVGENKHGAQVMGMMHIVMYASRSSTNWRAQLAIMADAIRTAVRQQADGAIIIKDFYTDADEPAGTGYRVSLLSVNQSSFLIALNPAIEGNALHIVYQYVERA